ncbi:MAG: hypothetical protein LQ340_006791 [Diploschistes diacapsis]|nr:MAG: hypothetical protein LQ340_006791 [Diploschistes diacapsis]
MAPIEHDLSNSNIWPIALFLVYITTTSFLLYRIGHSVLYRAHRALPPSQATRSREGSRRKHIETFAALAFVSLAFAISYGYNCLKLSYQVWAFERGETVPTGLFGQHGVLSSGLGQLQLGRWLHDTDILAEFWEIAMEKTRRRWWTQQLLLTTGPWSLYVAIQEGRRNIPHAWTFIALAPLISVSLAMNLFFLAVLWTPVPTPGTASSVLVSTQTSALSKHRRKTSKSIRETAEATAATTSRFRNQFSRFVYSCLRPKPSDWTPHTLVYVIPLLMTATDALLLTLASNTPSFKSYLRDALFNTILPLVLPRILPLAAGKSSSSEATAKSRALAAFRTASILSTIFYVLQTLVSLIDSDPGAHRHRHSLLYFHLDTERTKTARARSAFSHVLGSLTDHPSVGRVGWDALLCSVSLASWASIRGLEPRRLLRAAGWASKLELDAANEVKALVAKEVEQLIHTSHEEPEEEEPIPRRRGRKRAGAKGKTTAEEEAGEKGEGAADYEEGTDHSSERLAVGQHGDEENETEWENGAMAWGMMALGGLATGAASVLGSEVGI